MHRQYARLAPADPCVGFSAGSRAAATPILPVQKSAAFASLSAGCWSHGTPLVATMMSRSSIADSNIPRGTIPRATGPSGTYAGTVLSIVLLLAGWFIIGHWNQLPALIDSTMAALP